MWKRFKSLFTRKSQDALVRYKRPGITLTLSEFQKNDSLVTEAMKISATPIWRVMMEVMKNECLSNSYQFQSVGVPIVDRAVFQAQVEGYMMAINNLETMSTPYIEEIQPEATFAPEEG
jgi:hypothetical protein